MRDSIPFGPSFILALRRLLVLLVFSSSVPQLSWALDAEDNPVPSIPRQDVLIAGGSLAPGQRLTSHNGQYRLEVQSDGNVVVYTGNTPIWASNTAGISNIAKLVMQLDGNLVLYNTNGKPFWSTDTASSHPTNSSFSRYLRLTDNGKLVIHGDAGRPSWNGAVMYNAVRFYARALQNVSGKPMCIDVEKAKTNNHSNVQLYDCNGYAEGDAQSFIYNVSDKSIRMRADKNKCIDIDYGYTSNGTNAQIYDCNGSAAQKFNYNASNGTLSLESTSSKCLDISGANRSTTDLNGTNIQLWTCQSGNVNQQFDMGVSGGTGIPIWISSINFRKHNNTSKCIDISGGGMSNGTNIQLWQCTGNDPQNFSYNKIDGTIRMASHTNKCLDVSNGNTSNSTNIQLWDCVINDAQRFDIDFKTGQIMLRKAPNKCVDVAGNNSWNGTNIQLYDCAINNTAQLFDLGSQIQRFSVDLRNVDDDVYIWVNGTERVYSKEKNPGLNNIDPSWLNQYGDNEIAIGLGNYGCYASSLKMALYRNQENRPAVTRSIYLPTTSHCGYQAIWKYNVNTITGRIREMQ